MRRVARMIAVAAALFIAVIAGFNLVFDKLYGRQLSDRNVVVNRINHSISTTFAESGEAPESIIADGFGQWSADYGEMAPESIRFIPLTDDGSNVFCAAADERCAVCSLYSADGSLAGLVEYRFADNSSDMLRLCVNIALTVCFVLVVVFLAGTYIKVILPFRRLSDYPERLARLRDIQKLPESRSRFFGKYVWGMNMLTDVLAANSRRIHNLEGEHQKLVTSIAHGVKTPVANIRLYTDAVRTGLYTDAGATADIADKIDKNAEKIQSLAEELMSASDASLDGCDIEMSTFSLSELAELVRSEYADRMRLLRIPFTVECKGAPVLESDKYALYRAVNQLLENALKYGDGSGITVQMMKQDDGFSISVRNRGELLPESELPYVFRSYWRGSNAADKSGSGIGLYVVHETARALGGSVHARRIEETSEMEFVIFLEK
ncbi:MAG: HAMP domain-containing sensor histidine kinase [Ruminococcus sp.]|nr:HAMP domain-containing sensor histidine kinase [Ruminococcus sp.]